MTPYISRSGVHNHLYTQITWIRRHFTKYIDVIIFFTINKNL